MKSLLSVLAVLVSLCLYAQNKSLGVGTATPNSNAALHVESPTNNQGFIMPRLTTAQRSGMSTLLTATDAGLMLYDTDLKTIYIWDGTTWKSSAEVAGGNRLSYPYKDSVTTALTGNDVFALKYNNPANKRVLRVESLSPTNGSSAVSVQQNGVGLGVFSRIDNPASGSTAVFGTTNSNLGGAVAPVGVYGESTGTGSLGAAFRINNSVNTFPALYAETNGTGPAARVNSINASSTAPGLEVIHAGTGNAIQTTGKIQAGQFIGDGSALVNLPSATRIQFPLVDTLTTIPTTESAIRLVNNNTATGSFGLINLTNLNANNGFSPLFIENRGTNGATDMVINNPTNTNDVIGATTNGLGRGAFFNVNNPANTNAAIFGTTNGPGRAIHGTNTGTGNGFAGLFQNTNATNTFPAIQANTVGTGPGVRVLQNAASVGSGVDVILQNTASTSVGFSVNHQGLGTGGDIVINNTANTANAFSAQTNGTGSAVRGVNSGSGNGHAGSFAVTNATNAFPALTVSTEGTGNAGFFFVNNPASATASLVGQTVGSGVATQGFTTGTGSAGRFEINNPANTSAALFATTNGTGNAITAVGRVQATQFIGDGSLLTNLPGSFSLPYSQTTATGLNALEITNTSASGRAGFFRVNNAAGAVPALTVQSNALGTFASAFFAEHTGSTQGVAGEFRVNNATNGSSAIIAGTVGTGYAAQISVNNSSNTSGAVRGFSNGGGGAVIGEMAGTGRAGDFLITNAANTWPSVRASTVGSGTAVEGTSTGTGGAGTFNIINAANGATALISNTNGLGNAGSFSIGNAGSSAAVVNIFHSGTGNAITANRPIQATQFIGDGSALTGLPSLTLPFSGGSGAATTLFDVTSTGSGSAPVGAFTVSNAASNANALSAATNGQAPAFVAFSNGPGPGFSPAANFSVTNATNNSPAIRVSTVGNGSAIDAATTGTGSALTAFHNGPGGGFSPAANFSIETTSNSSPGVVAQTKGTGQAASFFINNPASTNFAVGITTNGTGPALNVSTSTGFASIFGSHNGAGNIIQVDHTGTGIAGSFSVSNPANNSPAININHSGTGNAITANRPISINNGTTAGGAANFQIDNSSNTNSAISASTQGQGAALSAFSTGPGPGFSPAANFIVNNSANVSPSLQASTSGTGPAANFFVNNATSTGNALVASTNGSGMAANFSVNNSANNSSTLSASSSGLGQAASFSITNAGNSNSAISINHAGTGNAITANRPIQATAFIGNGSQLTNVLPAGLILPFGGATPPSGYLLCDGSAVSRTTYAALFAAIGTSWGVGDGSTTFNLPDLRGRFLRGVDGAAGNDPDAASRTATNGGNAGNNVGSIQADEFRSHNHGAAFGGGGSLVNSANSGGGSVLVSTTFSGGNETRPKNANVNYVIKF